MKRERIGLGMIGCGVISPIMYLPYMSGEYGGCRAELVAVSDAVEEKAAAAKERFGARKIYPDYRDLLADPEVEAVVIATNIATHAEIALAAAKAGKHILVQKPLAETMGEAEAIVAEAKRAGVKLQVEPAHMLNPANMRAQEAIASGALGQVCMVQAKAVHGGAEDRPWLFQRSGGGSVMLDMAVHALTWAVSLAGPARRVSAFTRTSVPTRIINGEPLDVDIDDNVAMLLEFEDGALGQVTANYVTVADLSPLFSVYGTEGTVHMEAPQAPYMFHSRKASYLDQQGWLTPTVETGHMARLWGRSGGNNSLSIGHFIECLGQDKEPAPNGEIALHVLEIMIKGAEAGRSGAAQTLETSFTPLVAPRA